MIFTIALDGPAAAGKGTIAKAVATHFGFAYLDTGLLYRAVGMKGGDPIAVAQQLSPQDLLRDDLRSHQASDAASRVAAIPEVRAALVAFQRGFARQKGGTVLDGRDIGTMICPEAEAKLFITAKPEIRATRRLREIGGDYDQILAALIARDSRDITRADAPLRVAGDAMVVDTSDMTIEHAIKTATEYIQTRVALHQ